MSHVKHSGRSLSMARPVAASADVGWIAQRRVRGLKASAIER